MNDVLHIGADQNDGTDFFRNNILGSLPSGYIYGQNVSNLISSLSIGYQDPMDFQDLPVPYVCIAADMVSGKAKVWHSGKITDAMRSTMSIPGIFAPVRVDGMVLVDGGLRDNYPTTLAREMGRTSSSVWICLMHDASMMTSIISVISLDRESICLDLMHLNET
jgi:NTE family protein